MPSFSIYLSQLRRRQAMIDERTSAGRARPVQFTRPPGHPDRVRDVVDATVFGFVRGPL